MKYGPRGRRRGRGREERRTEEKKIFYFSWWKNLSKGQKGEGGRRRQLVFVQNLETTCLVFVSFSCTRLLLLTIRFSDLAHFPKKRKKERRATLGFPLFFPGKKKAVCPSALKRGRRPSDTYILCGKGGVVRSSFFLSNLHLLVPFPLSFPQLIKQYLKRKFGVLSRVFFSPLVLGGN